MARIACRNFNEGISADAKQRSRAAKMPFQQSKYDRNLDREAC